jgi:2-polyprenyl-3-methyl-5-hydroxy-6-metoxy-1,4-benzoquinol methylase
LSLLISFQRKVNFMSEKNITQKTKEFYEQYHFPGDRPIDHDGLIFLRKFTKAVETISSRKNNVRVLDAGCGTGNTSISLAAQFKDIDFLGLDNSSSSLEKAKFNTKKRGLTNLKFRKWNLLKPIPGNYKFDIVLCLGVLHHTGNMEKVLINLNKILNDSGVMFLWIYGKHGRYNHSLNMRLLRMLLELKPEPENKIDLAMEFATQTEKGQPLIDLIGKTKTDEMQMNAFKSPVWIADQFLNPHEILIDMEELLQLTSRTGLKISRILGVEENISKRFFSEKLSERFLRLSKNKQLIAADLLLKPERYFVVLQKLKSGRRKK